MTIEAANGEVTIDDRPTRIVSLSPTATEMLFAIGAGEQVEAVDDNSNYPPEAPTSDLSGFEPNAEAIAGFDPDLVVISYSTGEIEEALAAVDIPVLLLSAATTLDDTYEQIEQLGLATGHQAEAAAVVSSMQSRIEELVEAAPEFQDPVTYYHELDPTFFTTTSATFIGQIYDLVGLENIADAAAAGAPDYPQLSAEYIVDADPDLIFLADTKCCGQSLETIADRPGWDQMSAVENGAVVELDDDVASRWGPRVVELLATVVEALEEFEQVLGQ
ncbi:MAG TPA: ABC transporter substrate-binding protein [Candidatus Caenarcaniphilales bacterium]|nr:ABC transporter substrate-binding protein [Candidatus Caenarcaniphilales bacterium]